MAAVLGVGHVRSPVGGALAEERLAEGHLAVRDPDDTDRGAGPGNGEGGGDGLGGAHAFERGVGANTTGELEDGLAGFRAACLDDVGSAEVTGEVLAFGAAAEGDDALRAEPLGCQAPSPTIATTSPLFTPALSAAWCPVGITSDRASSDRSV